jgi:predicted transcriptional regulator
MAPGRPITPDDDFETAGVDSMGLLKVLLFIGAEFGFWHNRPIKSVAQWRRAVPAKTKITVSLDPEIVDTLGRVSRKTGTPRSRLVGEALRLWQRVQLEEALKEGYRAMAKADRAAAEGYLSAAREVLE